jgi:prepilin-type processing-associated H-X9-DG protein
MRQLTAALLNYAADNNNMLPDSRNPDGSWFYSWDLLTFPYLGIQDGYSGSPLSPQVKPGLDLDVLRCPLDSRKASPADAFYPRSYGITATAVYFVLPGDNQPFGGGIPGRRRGEGMRLSVVAKPSQYVILCRVGKDWEVSPNTVGFLAQHIYNGPDPRNPALWEQYRPLFGGKTPYGFADGHVALLDQQEALLVNPNDWNVNK